MKKKILVTKKQIKIKRGWNYSDLLRIWNKEDIKNSWKRNSRTKITNFLFKIFVVFIASFLTTAAFHLLLRPNGIYNSGLNGLLQTFFEFFSGKSDIIRKNYNHFLFGTSLTINFLLICFLGGFFGAEWEMMSTAVFYSGFQLFWSWIIEKFYLNKYLFSNLTTENWSYLVNQKHLGFTLPFYIAISIGAAIIHSYGYSLIFQARATPGGLEIITSYFTNKKNSRTPLKFLFKIFGFSIIFLITIISFLLIDDNPNVKKAELKTHLEKQNFLQENDDLDRVLENWKNNWQKRKNLEKTNSELKKQTQQEQNQEEIKKNQEEIAEIEVNNSLLTTLLKKKISSGYLDEYPIKEIDAYLESKQNLISSLKSEIQVIEKNFKTRNNKEENKKYLEYLKKKLERTEKDYCDRSLFGYLKYVTNNERLWATIVYIFFSSLLINQMFPKDIKVVLSVQTSYRDKLNKLLSLLREFNPTYYTTSAYEQKNPGEEKVIYVVNCFLSKWKYYLLEQELKSLKVIYFINERS